MRSHDGRWRLDPGNLQRRWAPCVQAQGQGQGQLPLDRVWPQGLCVPVESRRPHTEYRMKHWRSPVVRSDIRGNFETVYLGSDSRTRRQLPGDAIQSFGQFTDHLCQHLFPLARTRHRRILAGTEGCKLTFQRGNAAFFGAETLPY
ncbi:MAG: hypothetical protein E2577_20560 [Starkeya sp.]|nr:hypothetical protein [Starkeya sp.]